MLDYDDLEALESFALAANTAESQQLLAVASSASVVKPGQAFLAGLAALEVGDLSAASQQVQKLRATARHSDHARRLEALVALRSWTANPKATCAYLENFLSLSFHAAAPAVATPSNQTAAASAAPQLSSALDPALYSGAAFLQKAVRQARRPGISGGAGDGSSAVWSHLSQAGKLAALSYNEELGLELTPSETLQVVGAGPGDGGILNDEEVAQALAGSPLLASIAVQALAGRRVSLFESALPYLTSEQLESLMVERPGVVGTSPRVLAAIVRKMYGATGLTPAAAAAALDLPSAAAATSRHPPPLLTAAEADAIRHKALELCAKMKGAPARAEPHCLAWVEVRALVPLAEAAVQAAAFAAATTTAEEAGAPATTRSGVSAAARKVAEAAELTARLLRAVAAQGLPDASGLFAAAHRSPGHQPPPSHMDMGLGPALPPVRSPTGQSLMALLGSLLHLSADPAGLFAAGGVLQGLLEKRIETRLLAEAMLTRGSLQPTAARGGNAQAGIDWAEAYRDAGGDVGQLAEAVELNLTGPENVGEGAWEAPDDDVVLLLTHKAVRHISVLVYEIDTEAYYKEKGVELDMGIDLEGLGATVQFEINLPYGLPSLQRCSRAIPLPSLKGRRGVWVVDVQGGGRHSRALVRRGGLVAVVRPSPAGLALTLCREDGTPVADPRVWLDGRMYRPTAPSGPAARAAAAREVVVPYRASSPANVTAVLVDAGGSDGAGGGGGGGFASLMTLRHLTEEYELSCAMHFEPETAAAGGRGGSAPLLLQPSLTIGGWVAPLELLQDVTLTVEVDDLEVLAGTAANSGGSSSSSSPGARQQVFQDWSPGDGRAAAVVQVRLPDRPGRVRAVLTARLRRVAGGSDGEAAYQSFREERTWTLNESETEPDQLRDLYLTRGSDGGYLLRLLGRAGEPFPGVPVALAVTHSYSQATAPPPESTLAAPPGGGGRGGPGGGGAGDGDGDGGNPRYLVLRQTLVTDATGCIDLGPLTGITAVAAGLDATPASAAPTAQQRGARRRRYCWRLPAPASGLPADGANATLRKELLLRGLEASRGGGAAAVQFCVPFAAVPPDALLAAGSGNDTAPGGSLRLRRRLGVVLVSDATAALNGDEGLPQAAAWGAPPPPPPPDHTVDLRGKPWEVSLCLDEHVTVRQGYIEVSGLPPGVYRLVSAALNLAATLLVYRGPVITAAAHSLAVAAAAAATDAAAAAAGAQQRSAFGFVLSRGVGLLAPLSEARPLQLLDLRASADGGVSAQLAGSPEQLAAAVVHVVLARFETNERPHGPPDTALVARQPSAGPGTSFGVAPAGRYQSGRRLGDEVRYVLERRRLVSEGRVRPMPALVDRPSLLMQPWKVRETQTAVQTAQQGERFAPAAAAFGAPGGGARKLMAAAYMTNAGGGRARGDGGGLLGDEEQEEGLYYRMARCAPMYAPVPSKDVGALGLAFCPPAVVLANVTVGPNGAVQLTPQQLAAAVAAAVAPTGVRLQPDDPWVAAGHRVVRMIAYTAPAGVPAVAFGGVRYTEARAAVAASGGAAQRPVRTDPRVTTALQRPFPAGSACVERRSCHPLQPGSDLVIADAATAKLQLYGSVPKVWALFGSLLSLAPRSPWSPDCAGEGAALWAEFACVSSWNKLPSPAKVQRFSQLACRELAFFVHCHDPEFFRSAVLPYLVLRLPSSRCCLDAWLAGVRGRALVQVWGPPHRYRTLTVLERILLAWEEDRLAAPPPTTTTAEAAGQAPLPLPRLSRLAADMRARIRALAVGPGAAAVVADVNRRRFEIALNGPGQGDGDGGQGADLATLKEVAFDSEMGGPFDAMSPYSDTGGLMGPPRPAMMAMAMAAPAPPRMARMAAAAPLRDAVVGAMQMEAANLFGATSDLAARRAQEAAPAYRAPPATQEWAEAGWFRRDPTEALDPFEISAETEFWADLADHLARGGRLGPSSGSGGGGGGGGGGSSAGPAFLPRRLEAAGWSFSDALLATAAVGVPWEDATPLAVTYGPRLTLTASAPTIAYVRQTAATSAPADATTTTTTTTAITSADPPGPQATSLPRPQPQPQVLLLQRLMDPNLDPSELPALSGGSRRNRAGEASGRADGEGEVEGEEEEEEEEGTQLPSGEGAEVPAGSPLTYGRLYCYAVTLTNTGPCTLQLDVTVQAPQGAIALAGRPSLWITAVELMPYGAHRLPPYYFYFPRPVAPTAAEAGGGGGGGGSGVGGGGAEHDAYPAAASVRGRIRAVAFAQPSKLKVVSELPAAPPPDLGEAGGLSWTRLAALPATPEADAARLRYLADGDLASADLSLVLWRCREGAFWRGAVAALRQRRVWDFRLWSYAVLHQDTVALQELLPACDRLKDLLGPEAPAAGDLFTGAAAAAAAAPATAAGAGARGGGGDGSGPQALLLRPDALLDLLSSADRAPHLEYWPLVNARAHPLGSKRAILNDAVDKSWRTLLRRLAATAAAGRQPGSEDLLTAAYFLALQDRAAEASTILSRLDAALTAAAAPAAGPGNNPATAATALWYDTPQRLQICYLRAWLTLADPGSDASALRAAAAAVRQWTVTPADVTAVAAAAAAAAAGAAAPAAAPLTVLEPKWQTRLAAMVSALEDAAAIAAGNGDGGSSGGATMMGADAAAAATAAAAAKTAGPVLMLYDSPEGPRGAVVLEAIGVDKVSLSAHHMDLELLFSAAPFETSLTAATAAAAAGGAGGGGGARGGSGGGGGGGQSRFAVLRPSWSTTLDLQAIAASGGTGAHSAFRLLSAPPTSTTTGPAYKLLLLPHQLVQQHPATAAGAESSPAAAAAAATRAAGATGGGGALLLEAAAIGAGAESAEAAAPAVVSSGGDGGGGGGGVPAATRRVRLACYRCGLRVVAQRERGVLAVAHADSGAPVGGAYVKAYVKYDTSTADSAPAGAFHKDGYTDRRGLMDYWSLTSKPPGKVCSVALFVSHPDLGSTVLHVEPPLQG